jgi:hypothetical protein
MYYPTTVIAILDIQIKLSLEDVVSGEAIAQSVAAFYVEIVVLVARHVDTYSTS